MTLLPFAVLALGLVGGVVTALVLARRTPRDQAADLELRIADLRGRRDEIYERLRVGDESDRGERQRLEQAAARTLRDLERLEAQQPAEPRSRRRGPAPSAPAGGTKHPLLVGFLLGAGMAGLVAVLVFWAQGDATPDPAAATAQAPTAEDSGIDRGEPALPPAVSARVEGLREQLRADPDDLGLRKSLAQLLLTHGQFFDAFQEAQYILRLAPSDADGNYVAGVVRLTMGQADAALDHFERALDASAGHAPAAMMRAVLVLQMGDRAGAVAGLREALAASGGHPGLEHVLSLAEEGRSAEEILGSPPP